MSRTRKILVAIVATPVALVLVLAVVAWATSFRPPPTQDEAVQCNGSPKELQPGQKLKVLSWNVQYMAGKNYVFYYDILDSSGPDARPLRKDIEATLADVARVLKEEDPDIILLQEVDEGAARTDDEDQTARLLSLLPADRWGCRAETFYWKSPFIPHPMIMGSVGLKLTTLSKYAMSKATRRALPLLKQDPATDLFYIKRAVLETEHPVAGRDQPLVTLNTHFDAFAQGTDVMARQVQATVDMLKAHSQAQRPWILGGDLNLIPPGKTYDRLGPNQQAYFNPDNEITPFFEHFTMVPSQAQVDSDDYIKWLTHFPNDPAVDAPDRTIDYIVLPKTLALGEHYVRQGDTHTISDHLPVVVHTTLP